MLEKLSKSELEKLFDRKSFSRLAEMIEALGEAGSEDRYIDFFSKNNLKKLVLSSASTIPKLQTARFWNQIANGLSDAEKGLLEQQGVSFKSNEIALSCLNHQLREQGFPSFQKDVQNIGVAIKTLPGSAEPFLPLKEFQTGVYFEAMRQLEIENNRFLIQMPTGSGKTRTAMEVVATVLKNQERCCVIWLAHTIELIDQAISCFEHVWAHMGNKDLELRVLDGQREGLSTEITGSAFIISTFQSLHKYHTKNQSVISELAKNIELVVVDEAHMAIAPTYKAITSALIKENSKLIGLTATPGRKNIETGEDESENKELAEYFLNNLISLHCPPEKSVFDHLRELNILSYAQTKEIGGSEFLVGLEEGQDISHKILTKLGNEFERNLSIIGQLKALINEGKKSIILFACSVEHSRFLTTILNFFEISSAHVDGTTSPTLRSEIIRQFKSGEISVLSNYEVLATGFDAPKTDVVFIARPTTSIVLYSQMIGRGLRGEAIGGTRNCTVVNVKDNLIGLPDPDSIFNYFDNYFVD